MPSKAATITRARFNAINREIKLGKPGIVIASNYHVSADTVKRIRSAKTWPEWLRRKDAYNKRARDAKKPTDGVIEPKVSNAPEVPTVQELTEKAIHGLMREQTLAIGRLIELERRITALESSRPWWRRSR